MAQMSGMLAAFQAQISDLSAKVNHGSSSPMPVISSMVTEVTMVRPEARFAPRVTMRLPLSRNTCRRLGLSQLCDVPILCPWPPGRPCVLRLTERTVMYDSSRTDPIVLRVNATLTGAGEDGSEATLSFLSP